MKLHYMRSMNPRKACVVAKHLELPVEYVLIDVARGGLQRPEYLALNPNGLAPVLEVEGRTIWESAAIMVYFALRAGSELWPVRDPNKQVDVVRWMTWDAWQFGPCAGTFYFEHLIKPHLLKLPTDAEAVRQQLEPFHRLARVLDSHLRDHEFLANDALSLADFCVGVLLPWAEEIHLPIAEYPNVQRWHARLMELPAWRNPWPE
ncbi:MAG TPA: glutathione S-transferase family protein [Polyangiaceae bacterium]